MRTRRLIRRLAIVLSLPCLTATVAAKPPALPDVEVLRRMAVEESLRPVRPGVPGKIPFWNPHAMQFIHAPAFDLAEVAGAVKYRFTARPSDDAQKLAYNQKHGAMAASDRWSFEAPNPWSALSPVWSRVPVGFVTLTVEGLDGAGRAIGVAGQRDFFRAAVWHGPYHEGRGAYRESARRGLEWLFREPHTQAWFTDAKPLASYQLFCYPSKTVASVIDAMLQYARIAPEQEAKQALAIARSAADYLIAHSTPAGSPYPHFPQTYEGTAFDAGMYAGQLMLIYPCGTAMYYLDLFDATGDEKYRRAADRIGETYLARQLPSGTWPLKVLARSGEPIAANVCVPTPMIRFFRRLDSQYGQSQYREPAGRAWTWIEQNPLKTYAWEGQFEDSDLTEPYKNLARGEACDVAEYLLLDRPGDPAAVAEAEQLLRFVEDQFVVWEHPMPSRFNRAGEGWVTPCALEQYNYYTPIGSSATRYMLAMQHLYQATGNPLHLAKALSIADTTVAVQDPKTGKMPTNWLQKPQARYWYNCAAYDCRALVRFEERLQQPAKH